MVVGGSKYETVMHHRIVRDSRFEIFMLIRVVRGSIYDIFILEYRVCDFLDPRRSRSIIENHVRALKWW